jgi:hypothetical protein
MGFFNLLVLDAVATALISLETHDALGAVGGDGGHIETQRMYGVWQRIHLSEGPSPGGGSFGSPRSGVGAPFRGAGRWWQRMVQRRNARVENAKVRLNCLSSAL